MTNASKQTANATPQHDKGSERWTIGALIVLFWIGFQIVYFVREALSAYPGISPLQLLQFVAQLMAKPVELSIVSAGAVICFCTYVALRQVRGLPLWRQLLVAGGAALIAAICFSLAVSVLSALFDGPWPALTTRFLIVASLSWLPAFGVWAGVALSVTYNFEMREREQRLALARAQAQEAQMRALRYQINPHLLYNTLNSIAALILDNQNGLAEDMLMRLSDFFRSSLSRPEHLDSPLIDEIGFQKLYLAIEEMRFGDRLAYEFDIDPEAEHIRVPNFILQPIIENVLKHGMNPRGKVTHVRVTARRDGGRLLLDVSDNGPGSSANAGTGVGLSNVRARLHSHYGDDAKLEAMSHPEGYTVRINVPA